MKELQRRQKIKRALYSLPALFVLLAVAFLMIKGAFGVVAKERESAKYVRELKEEVVTLSERSLQLEEDIARLNTKEGIIEEIKGKFNVSLPGEHVAILVDERAPVVNPEEKPDSWFKKWWSGLTGLWH